MKRTPPLNILAAALALGFVASGAQAATYTWNNGDFVVGLTAPSPLAPADVLDIGAGGNKFFSAVAFTNGGSVNWNAGPLFLQSGATVVNNALWNATSDDALVYNGGAAPSFTNSGIFRKSAGAGATTIGSGVGFINNGTLDAQSGSISFVGGSVFNAGSVFTGAGSVNFSSGTNTVNGAFTSSNLLLSGGVHQGAGAGIGGSVSWTGGTLAGTWGVGAGQTLQAATGSFKFIDGAATVLTNQGTVAWNTSDWLYLMGGAALSNQGLFVAKANTSIAYNGGSAPSFVNTTGATVRAAAGQTLGIGSGTGFVNNGGALDAQAGGSIIFNGGSVFNAGTQFTGAGSSLAAGNNSFNGAFNSANLVLQSGVHSGNAAVVGGSNTLYTGGTLAGSWGIGAGQTLQAAAGSFKFIDGAATVLTNQGTVAWNTSDWLYLMSGAALSNQGLFVANANTTIAYNGGSATRFDNTAGATLRAAAGKALSIGSGAGFVNNGGSLDAQAGASITFNGGSVFNAGTQFTGAGSNVAAGNNSFNGGFHAANLVLQSGVHSGNAALVAGQGTVFSGGTLAGTWQVGAGQTLSASSGSFKFVEGAATALANKGTLAWNTSDTLYLQSGAALANQGTLNFAADGGVLYNGGSAPSFVNTGLIAKTGGTGTTTIGNALNFDNQGTIDVQTGTIALPNNFINHGTLKGTGSFSVFGTLSNAGTVAPGASPGTLALVGNYAQDSGGVFAVELQSLASHDLFNISGTAALGGQLSISCYGACSLAVGDTITILDAAGDLGGSFASVALDGFATGAFSVIYDTVLDRVQLQVTQAVTAAVPEPGSWALWAAGAAFVLGTARRRRRA